MSKVLLSGSAAREAEIDAFLSRTKWSGGARAHLTGDASNRRYETVTDTSGHKALLMDAPPDPLDAPLKTSGQTYSDIAHLAQDCLPFVAIGKHLAEHSIKAPEIFDFDISKGLILLEDFGPSGIGPLLEEAEPGGPLVRQIYGAAIEVLGQHQKIPAPTTINVTNDLVYRLPPYDEAAMKIEVDLFYDWYLKEVQGNARTDTQKVHFDEIWNNLLNIISSADLVLVMRDYHSPNLHWLAGEKGTDRIGVIDFQDGLSGHRAYDLASLLQDARRDVPAAIETDLLEFYLTLCPKLDEAAFRRDYAIIAAQRVTKILGIFIRLWRRDGKKNYLRHIPRLWSYLERSLAHPVLSDYRDWLQTNVPQTDRKVEG